MSVASDGVSEPKQSLAARPEFYLVYLPFYFTPWFLRAPTSGDIAVGVFAVAMFLPIYFRAGTKSTREFIPHMLAIEAIAIATSPFHGMSGTYHIYAVCQAGFQRDKRIGISFIVLLSLIWIVTALLLGRHGFDVGIVTFIGILSSLGCMASTESLEANRGLKRARELDRQQAAVSERERIARDLHDVLGHTLTMVAVKSEVCEKLIDRDPQRALHEIREIRDAARDALSDIRKTVAGMVDTTLTDELVHAQRALDAAGVTFEPRGQVPPLPDRLDAAMGLALREAVTNIVRHSDATVARVHLDVHDAQLRMSITDNGKGLEGREGAGLVGLRQRIQRLGGEVEITSDSGTTLSVSIPLPAPVTMDTSS